MATGYRWGPPAPLRYLACQSAAGSGQLVAILPEWKTDSGRDDRRPVARRGSCSLTRYGHEDRDGGEELGL